MKKIVFDDSMGAAGDMIAAALLDLFDNPDAVAEDLNDLIREAGLEDVVVDIARKISDQVEGMEFEVEAGDEEERVDHRPDYPDHHHYEHRHDHPHFHEDYDHRRHYDHRPHDHYDHEHRYHDHFEHRPRRDEHRKPDHFERYHRCEHDHRPHEHFDYCHHRPEDHDLHWECRPPRRGMPPFMMKKPFGAPIVKIEGPIEFNLNINLGECKKPKKRRHHHHHRKHHRRNRPEKKITAKKSTTSMRTGKDHLN